MTEDQDLLIASAEARQILDNRHFRDAFQAVADYLELEALACDPDHKERAQRIILAKQLLWKVKREIERKVEDGDLARIRIEEVEKPKLFRFRR